MLLLYPNTVYSGDSDEGLRNWEVDVSLLEQTPESSQTLSLDDQPKRLVQVVWLDTKADAMACMPTNSNKMPLTGSVMTAGSQQTVQHLSSQRE